MIEFGVKIVADKLQGNYDSPKPVENADQLFPGTVHVHSCTIMNMNFQQISLIWLYFFI